MKRRKNKWTTEYNSEQQQWRWLTLWWLHIARGGWLLRTVREAGWGPALAPSPAWPLGCPPGGRSASCTVTRPSITGNYTGGSPRCGASPSWPRPMPASGAQRLTRTQCKSSCLHTGLPADSSQWAQHEDLLLLAYNEYKSSAIKVLANILRSQFYVPGTAKFYICSRNVGPSARLARYLGRLGFNKEI